jgi:hypothetical protein
MWEKIDDRARRDLRRRLSLMISQAMTPRRPGEAKREVGHE